MLEMLPGTLRLFYWLLRLCFENAVIHHPAIVMFSYRRSAVRQNFIIAKNYENRFAVIFNSSSMFWIHGVRLELSEQKNKIIKIKNFSLTCC